jgi:hypothetical protein
MQLIVSSAVKLSNGSVFTGKRHGDCYQMIKFITGDKESCKDSIQGFINDKLQFLDRTEAYHEALSCGQCRAQEPNAMILEHFGIEWKPMLASENLW